METGQHNRVEGFTLIEVVMATVILVILCAGTLSVLSHVSKINTGNNLRAQAQSVLQKKAEYYRSLLFVQSGQDANLNGRNEQNVGTLTSADGIVFNLFVTIDNDPFTANVQTGNDAATKFKEIKIRAVPQTNQPAWLANLNTQLTIQRVRGN